MSPFRAVSLSGFGDRVAVAESDRLRVFQFNAQTQEWSMLGQTITVENMVSVRLSRDGSTLVYGYFVRDPTAGKVSFVTVLGLERNNSDDKSPRWVQLGQQLLGTCGFVNTVSVSDNGTIVAVGDPFDSNNGGLVVVYRLDDESRSWNAVGRPIRGFASGDYSGAAVSLSGDGNTIAIGSPGSSAAALNAGLVRVMEYNPSRNLWTQVGQVVHGEFRQKQFGYSVSLSQDGKRVAVGSPFFEPFGVGEGIVFVYELQPGLLNNGNVISNSRLSHWTQLGEKIAGEGFADGAGTSVSLSANGNTVAVGAPGRAYTRVLSLGSTGWTEAGYLENRGIGKFGISVSLADTGRVVAIGGASVGRAGTTQVFLRTEEKDN